MYTVHCTLYTVHCTVAMLFFSDKLKEEEGGWRGDAIKEEEEGGWRWRSGWALGRWMRGRRRRRWGWDEGRGGEDG